MSETATYPDHFDEAALLPRRVDSRKQRVWAWVSVAVAVVLVVSTLGVYGLYLQLNGNIQHEDPNAVIGAANRPKKLNNAVNILMMGSDSRAGADAEYGRADGARSDTMILLHISPGGGQTLGISFPRDSMVPIPACKDHPAQTLAMINSAFTEGGPVCALHTIETLTNIKVDHFMVVDFSGFKNIVNALGGVQICLPKDVSDKLSKLYMKKGYHNINGEQALAYVRNRHGLGDGSDLDRIKRQQQFLGSVAKKALSSGTLSDPGKLLPLLQAGTKSLTTDTGFDASAMMSLAGSLRGLTAGKIKFVTVPWEPYVGDKNRIQFAQPAANDLFTAIREDRTAPDESKPKPSSAPGKSSAPKVPASQVKVRVFNASGTPGKAKAVADQLTAQGFQVLRTGTAMIGKTKILYGADAAGDAATLNDLIPGVTAASHTGIGTAGVVDLVVGTDFPQLKGDKPKPMPSLQDEITATDDICKH
jgi:LCP family protein required for cell wall assembly